MMRRSRSSWRMGAAALLAVVLLAMIIVSAVLSKTRVPLAYTQAQISVPQGLPEEPGIPEIAGRTISIDDPEQIRRLVEFFPGLDRGRRSNFRTRGWIAPIQITLTRPDGSMHSFETNFEYWREDRNDHHAEPGLESFIRGLFEAMPRVVSWRYVVRAEETLAGETELRCRDFWGLWIHAPVKRGS